MNRTAAHSLLLVAAMTIVALGCFQSAVAQSLPTDVAEALASAGTNRSQLEAALERVSPIQREGMLFLIANMPPDDLSSLSAEFLVNHVTNAYGVMNDVAWASRTPKDVFLNNVLPYSVVNERRESWRVDFRTRFLPMIKDCTTPSHAAARLNQKVFGTFGVYYSPERLKADQSPYESIEYKKASCTGLSILLIAACRSVGVPARFAGTPLWTDRSGNHSWVEIWDDGWHFTGAAEPDGDALDRAWFTRRAAEALRDSPDQAIYATSYRKTPLSFPMVWAPSNRAVSAVNVTDRYTRSSLPRPGAMRLVGFVVRTAPNGPRVAAQVRVTDAATGKMAFAGEAKDDRFDLNDTLETYLPSNTAYRVEVEYRKCNHEEILPPGPGERIVEFVLPHGSNLDAAILTDSATPTGMSTGLPTRVELTPATRERDLNGR